MPSVDSDQYCAEPGARESGNASLGRLISRTMTLALFASVLTALGCPSLAGACSFLDPDFRMVGHALSVDGRVVVLRVDSVDWVREGPVSELPQPGATIEVRYPSGEISFLEADTTYRLSVWDLSWEAIGYRSNISGACGTTSTEYADGSQIDTNDGNDLRLALGGAAAVFAAAAGIYWWIRRRADRAAADDSTAGESDVPTPRSMRRRPTRRPD